MLTQRGPLSRLEGPCLGHLAGGPHDAHAPMGHALTVSSQLLCVAPNAPHPPGMPTAWPRAPRPPRQPATALIQPLLRR
ncbi:hypothetical protein PG989_000991 [Apiospora arundinis]